MGKAGVRLKTLRRPWVQKQEDAFVGVLQGILRFDLPVAVPADHARMTINKSGIVMRRMVERVARIHGFRNRAAPAGSVGWGQLHGESVYSTVVTILPTIATVLNALEPLGFLRFYRLL